MKNYLSGFDQNPKLVKLILAKIIQSAIAREVARKARENVKKKKRSISQVCQVNLQIVSLLIIRTQNYLL